MLFTVLIFFKKKQTIKNHYIFLFFFQCKAFLYIYRFIYKALHSHVKSIIWLSCNCYGFRNKGFFFSSSEIHNFQCLKLFFFSNRPLSFLFSFKSSSSKDKTNKKKRVHYTWRGVGTLEPWPSWDKIHFFVCVQESEHLCLFFIFFFIYLYKGKKTTTLCQIDRKQTGFKKVRDVDVNAARTESNRTRWHCSIPEFWRVAREENSFFSCCCTCFSKWKHFFSHPLANIFHSFSCSFSSTSLNSRKN